MIISIRTKGGWKRVKNSRDVYCDRCGQQLWIAPSDELYCDGKNGECVKIETKKEN